MSSDYSIYCMSHDPAIEVDYDRTVGEVTELVAAGLAQHPGCDLLVARYSGALIELGCPGSGLTPFSSDGTPPHRGHSGAHRDTVWAEAGLLRVAAACIETERDGHAEVITKSLGRMPMCWTHKRLNRLRYVLEVAL